MKNKLIECLLSVENFIADFFIYMISTHFLLRRYVRVVSPPQPNNKDVVSTTDWYDSSH